MSPVTQKSLMDLHPRELKGMIHEIPTLPVIYQELFRKMQDPEVSVSQIAAVITQDQALTAKILHLVNSAFYGFARQIDTISRAVVILGFRAVRSAALAISVFDYFQGEGSTGSVDIRRFWTHSIAVAAIAKVLATEIRSSHQEEVFVAGLLHDAGKLIEKRYFPGDFDELCHVAQEQHLTWIGCENQLFQVNHATIGKAVFRAWGFPPSMVEAIHLHHDPVSSPKTPQLTALVHVADCLSYQLDFGAPGAWHGSDCASGALQILHLEPERLPDLNERILQEMDHSLEILKLLD